MWDLNSETLRSMKVTTSRLLVKFFQPWCKACREFSPEFKKAAKISEDLGLGIVFAQVNLQNSPDLVTEFGINTFPRILFWANGLPGDKGPKCYFKKYGLKANRLINWLRSRVDYASTLRSRGGSMITCDAMFQCDDGMCVSFQNVCDQYNQCRDGSDERFCVLLEEETDVNDNGGFYPVTTSRPNIRPTYIPLPTWGPLRPQITTQPSFNPITPNPNENEIEDSVCDFTCNDGTCQPNSKRCDGNMDCLDGIDETNCGVCKRTDFTCVSGGGNECVPYLKRCDEHLDCEDGSDELNCAGILDFHGNSLYNM